MSNKKFSRSKKSDGNNVPNFVFKIGGDAPVTPNFNFSGSQPASPSASPGGFGFSSNPGSPASTSFNFGSTTSPASSQPFVFGDPAATPTAAAASPTTNNAFNFGSSASSTNAPFGVKRVQSDQITVGPERGSLRRTNSELSFSVPPATTSQLTGAFSFGTPAASPTAAPTNSFNFGSNAATNNSTPLTTQPSAVSFGSSGSQSSGISFSTPAPATTTTTTAAPATTGGISFGLPAASSTSSASIAIPPPTTTSSSSGFSFGTPAKPAESTSAATSAPTSAFSFRSATSTATKPSSTTTPTFGFGASTTNTTDKPTAAPAATTASPFSLSTSTPASTATLAATTPTFSFGKAADSPKTSTATTPAATTTSPFSFGSPAATSKPSSDKPATTAAATTAATSTSSTPSFSFNSPKPAASTTSTTSSTPVFSFGSPATGTSTSSAAPATTTAAAATSNTTTPASAPSSSLFSLGTISADKDGKKAGSSVTSAPFTFGAASTSSSATTIGAAPSIPAVDPNKPNPFSFSKILDDLAKIAAQPPNQMYASLITPALAALQQNQIVNHTNFRIDNILPSTRFTELPEQAQKELDDLEKYIRLEGQRCEYIGNHKVPQHLNDMAKAKKDTESLSQQLDALSSTLKGQMESIESLYESVKTQLRHANDGCAVIEACKHPGNNARWLFGYSEDDDYFLLLAKQLNGRLEEYKKCIWEIERTVESWTHNRVQSPQDIADIMRAQNQAFLALSNKVASLHESVNVEKNYYNQYLQMYT